MNTKWLRVVLLVLIATILAGLIVACSPGTDVVEGSGNGENATLVEYIDDDIAFTWPGILRIALLIAAGIVAYLANRGTLSGNEGFSIKKQFPWWAIVLMFLVATGIKAVPINSVATVRQVFPYSRYEAIGPGTHLVMPLVTKVNIYTTRTRTIEITGINADSNSPSRPEVFPDVTIWFRLPVIDERELDLQGVPLDPETLKILDFRYGPEYEETLGVKRAVSAVKEILGSNGYDYIGNRRQDARERFLELMNAKFDGLVQVTAVEIVDFRYTPEFEARLAELSQKQIELEQAQRNVVIAEQDRLKAEKQKETTVLNAEAAKAAAILQAEGDAERIRVEAAAQAEALALTAEQLRQNSTLLQYEWIHRWNGILPQIVNGENGGFLYQLSPQLPQVESEEAETND